MGISLIDKIVPQAGAFRGMVDSNQLITFVRVATDTYAVGSTDNIVICNKASAMTVNLPTAVGYNGILTIKSIGAGAVTVDGNGSETIDGDTTQVLGQYDCIDIVSDNDKWSII